MAKWTAPLKWDNSGTEPSASLKQSGFTAGYLPPAETFNYFLHNHQVCIEELQEKFDSIDGNVGCGKLMEGKEVSPTYGTTVIAGTRSEIYNDTRPRTFDQTSAEMIYNIQMICNEANSSATVTWNTRVPCKAKYRHYTPTTNWNVYTEVTSTYEYKHSATITGLSKQAYSLEIKCYNSGGTEYTITREFTFPTGLKLEASSMIYNVQAVCNEADGSALISWDTKLSGTSQISHYRTVSQWGTYRLASSISGYKHYIEIYGMTSISYSFDIRHFVANDEYKVGPYKYTFPNGFSMNFIDNEPTAGNIASGTYSHAEGTLTTASDNAAHAEGYMTTAGGGNAAHAEGYSTIAQGHYVHVEGYRNQALANNAHVEGTEGLATTGGTAHVEGRSNTAGNNAHAEGERTAASGIASHAEGYLTTAKGNYSTACNYQTTAGQQCLATGYGTIASDSAQAVFGVYNKSVTGVALSASTHKSTESQFVVGVGTSDTSRSNAFRVTMTGQCYGKASFNASGADYAEYFEWEDGNPDNEDRRGLFVTLYGDLIRKANADDDYILGVVSAAPSVLGNCYADEWQGKYVTDVFGEPILQTVEIPEETKVIVEEVVNDEGKIIIPEQTETIPAHTIETYILNPDYDPTQKYVSRENRPEWDAIGTHGQLVVIDDGTCKVNTYCTAANGGIATAAAVKTPYRVMERLNDNHIKVYINSR